MLDLSKHRSSLSAPQAKMELHSWPQPCSVMYCRHHFSSCLALESLFLEQQGQWSYCPASLWICTAVSSKGKLFLCCPWVQQICSGMGYYEHLSKRCHIVRSARAPRAHLGMAEQVARSSCSSEHNFSLRYGRRPCSLGSCQGYVLWEMGFHRVADPLANSQLWEQGSSCLFAVVERCPRTAC